MTTNKIADVYEHVTTKTNYSKVHSALKQSKIQNYLQLITSEEMVAMQKTAAGKTSSKVFNSFIVKLFQSLTNVGFTTYEIVEFICSYYRISNKNQRKEIYDYIRESFIIIHADYSKKRMYSNKFNKEIIDLVLFGHDSASKSNVIGNIFNEEQIKSNQSIQKEIKAISTITSNRGKYEFSNFNDTKLNSNIVNPSKTNTSVSSIIIKDPSVKVGSQNSLELSTFFNALTTLELNRSHPYVNATFILPSLSSQVKVGNGKYKYARASTSIGSFLFGTKNKNKNFKSVEGDKNSDGNGKTNMSIFTSPQTMVNFDENYGKSQNQKPGNRKNSPIDPTQPFMTIKSFTINAASTKGLMSYKSGTLTVVLHDRARMNDIAPFVKPDLLGAFGAEIMLEYGWSNLDEKNIKNPIGYFIGNSKIIEKYMIINSNMSIDNSGQVNISLSIAMKGPHLFKNQKIETSIKDRIERTNFESDIQLLDYERSKLFSKNKNNKPTKTMYEIIGINQANLADIFSETSAIKGNLRNSLTSFVNTFTPLIRTYRTHISLKLDSNNNEKKIIIKKEKLQNLLDTDTEETVVANKLTVSPIAQVHTVINITSNLINKINVILSQDKSETAIVDDVIKKIMCDNSILDFFWPVNVTTLENVTKIEKSDSDFITLGTIINAVIQNYIANTDKTSDSFDEIQTIFYTANDNAGAARHMPLSNILIYKQHLKELLEKIFSKRTVITPEALLTQIITECVQKEDNITYGLHDLYVSRVSPQTSVFDPVKRKTLENKSENKAKSSSSFNFQKQLLLRNIYNNSGVQKFILPSIHINFDCLSSGDLHKERTILRISVFDRADTPFTESSNILESLYEENIRKNLQVNNKFSPINSRKRPDLDNAFETKSQMKFIETQKALTHVMLKLGFLRKNPDGSFAATIKAISNKNNFKGSIKDVYKEIYPSLTFGAQNSIMISASVSTINDNKLGTIFMTRPDRNNQSTINNRIEESLPLRIMPTQATVEIYGCPWVNFGQAVFLDFDTGTTLDNKYVVTGISHNLSPGKFTTQLTLTYGDNYGRLENFDSQILSSQEIQKEINMINNRKVLEDLDSEIEISETSTYYDSYLTLPSIQ